MANRKEVIQKLASVPAAAQRLRKEDFDLSNATSNQRSLIGEYEVETPVFVREEPMRLMFVTTETFTTDGTAGNTETFNLSYNLISTVNTADLVLYEGNQRVQPDAVDADADTFDYTDDGTGNDLHAHYVFREPVEITIEKSAPSAQGNVSQPIYDDPTPILHERDQNQEPPEPEFETPLEGIVPRNWTIEIYAEGPLPVEYEDPDGNTASNAIIRVPINRAKKDVKGLGQVVKQDIAGV